MQLIEAMHSPSPVLHGSKGRRIGPASNGMIARPPPGQSGGRGQALDGLATIGMTLAMVGSAVEYLPRMRLQASLRRKGESA